MWEADEASGELWKLFLLFMMKGMVSHSLCGTHKVMTTLILVVLVLVLPELREMV